ncbi:hypothetical protein EalM132_00029 [Exiguobacterium phage vB_EalM-132]|nr:hypothetical protein EalM132_00029 [Exiguobacterium phage vB_EalM-132]
MSKDMELKDLPKQAMNTIMVFDEDSIPLGSIIKHYLVDAEGDHVREIRKGIVTGVDQFFIYYTGYSEEDDCMTDYNIHHSDIYNPNGTKEGVSHAFAILDV